MRCLSHFVLESWKANKNEWVLIWFWVACGMKSFAQPRTQLSCSRPTHADHSSCGGVIIIGTYDVLQQYLKFYMYSFQFLLTSVFHDSSFFLFPLTRSQQHKRRWERELSENHLRGIFFPLQLSREQRNQRSNNKTLSSKVYLITSRRRAHHHFSPARSQFLSARCWWLRLKNALACQTNSAKNRHDWSWIKNAPFCALVYWERISSAFLLRNASPEFPSDRLAFVSFLVIDRVALIDMTTITEMRIFGSHKTNFQYVNKNIIDQSDVLSVRKLIECHVSE